jgi:hypothetical protein
MQELLIKKGEHYEHRFPWRSRPFFGDNRWEGVMYFTESCAYEFNPEQQLNYDHHEDCNKLFGPSLGLFNGNHETSARLAWRWSKKVQLIELPIYTYLRGQKMWDAQKRFPILDSVPLEKWIGWQIIRLGNNWWFRTFEVDEKYTEMGKRLGMGNLTPRIDFDRVRTSILLDAPDLLKEPRCGWTQHAYFGGQLPAQHDTRILFALQ